MTLSEWLEAHGEMRHVFARRLSTSPGYITDLCNKRTQPSLKMAQRIMEATGGAVKPEDWFAAKPS
jgi:DNA-binding transcriptional regulator YdaS (Cro superfamily)